METNKDIKLKVSDIVAAYIKNYSVEWSNFQKQQRAYRENLKNEWAEMKGSDIMVRELNRIPETLFALLKIGLSEAEYLEFKELKMQQWFGNKFRDFNVTDKTL